jgi:MFS family permease
MHPRAGWTFLTAIGVTQILSWGSMYYAFAVLIDPLMQATQGSRSAVVGAFSIALLVSGLATPFVGSVIDRIGGRAVMSLGSLAAAGLFAALPHVQNLLQLYLLWAGFGACMAATLYEPAFVVLTQVFGAAQRRAITIVTLFGGLASTVFWPLTQALVDRLGWQDAVLVLAAINLCITFPVHAVLLPSGAPHAGPAAKHTKSPLGVVLRDPVFYALAAGFTGHMLVFSGMTVQLLDLLQAKGLSAAHAAWVGAMFGPMQVLGRLMEFTLMRRMPATRVGVIAMWLLPISIALLLAPFTSWAWFALFAVTFGIGNGIITIVRGAIPRELYGAHGYGVISGALAAPALLARAGGPMLAAALAGAGDWTGMMLWLVGLSAAAALVFSWPVRRQGAATGG